MELPGAGESERHVLVARIADHLRRYGAESTRVIEVFAHTHAMHPSDLQALVVVLNAERQGDPATPGTLGAAVGLTSGAVTGVVDRLVRSGHVRREPDPTDRRKIRLRYADAGMALAAAFFAPLGARTTAIVDEHTDGELRVIESFLARVVDVTIDYRTSLQTPATPSG